MRIRKLIRILITTLVLSFSIFGFVVFVKLIFEVDFQKFYLSPKTKYALRFNNEEFQNLNVGVSEYEVIRRLGSPLSSNVVEVVKVLKYMGDEEGANFEVYFTDSKSRVWITGDFPEVARQTFTISDFIYRCGDPSSVESNKILSVYRYSKPVGAGSYYEKTLYFVDGVLKSKLDAPYFD